MSKANASPGRLNTRAPLSAQPRLVPTGPGLGAVIDDPLAQQQFRQPVPCGHQISTHILSNPDQVPRGFLLHARDRDRDDLTQVQQPGQVPGVVLVGLDPNPARALQLRGRRDPAINPFPIKNRASPNPVGPAS